MGPVFVFIAIMIAIGIATYMTVSAFSRAQKKGVGAKITAMAVCITVAAFTVVAADYLDASNRTVEYELYAVVEVDTPHSSVPGERFWHGAYEERNGGEGFFYSTEAKRSQYGESWPELNLSEYSYIITYGQELRLLTYNVWNTIDIPVRTGLYQGNAILCEEFNPYIIYIYQIPKLKIDNYP